jgi:ATP-binding cassette subfamily B protein
MNNQDTIKQQPPRMGPMGMGHGPGGMMGGSGEKAKNFKGTISKLIRYLQSSSFWSLLS